MSFEKTMDISILLDFYSSLITPRQRDIVDLYYNEDFSLSEISENLGITRQGVRDGLKKAEEALVEAEEKLSLYKLYKERESLVNFIEKRLSETNAIYPDIMEALARLKS